MNPTPVQPAKRSKSSALKSAVLAALAVVNGAMGISLVSGMIADNTAQAQNAGRPSEYVMIPARISNLGSDILYVLDTQTGNLTAIAYDQQGRSMQNIAPVPLGAAFQQANNGR